MTADLTPSLAEQKAAEAHDRKHILAQLAREAATPTGRYVVLRHLFVTGEVIDRPVSHHRFEWVAELCAWREARRHSGETGGHYTVRRAEA